MGLAFIILGATNICLIVCVYILFKLSEELKDKQMLMASIVYHTLSIMEGMSSEKEEVQKQESRNRWY